jgi:hypothetical protein
MKDSRGEAWTHHWSNQDIYSRIDFIMVSHALGKEVLYRACHIIDDPDWHKACDDFQVTLGRNSLLAIFK